MSILKTSSSSEPRPMGRIMMASSSSSMFMLLTLKWGLYPICAISLGKVKHTYGMLRLVSASRIWVELHASMFRVMIPIFKSEPSVCV